MDLKESVKRFDNPAYWAATTLVCAGLARLTQSTLWHARCAYGLERLGRDDLAQRAYERAVARPATLAEFWERLGNVRARQGDWVGAASAYEAAIDLDGQQADGLEGRIADVHQRIADRRAAIEQARCAVAESGPAAAPRARLHLARLLDGTGQWAEARSVLEATLAETPRHAASQRLLAQVAHQMWTWNGYFEGDGGQPEDMRFRWLPTGDGRSAEEALTAACEAMERAVGLQPAIRSWRVALGELREESGYLAGAISTFASLVEDAESTAGRWAFRSLHRWQYRLERAHHAAGRPRVEDPLFDCGVTVDDDAGDERPANPPGFFTTELEFSGLAIRGFVTSREVAAVTILLDGQPVRALNVGGDVFFGEFGIHIRRATLELFPQRGRLEVRAGDQPLVAAGRGSALHVTVPHGSGRLLEVLAHGSKLDKKGEISPSSEELRARQDGYLELYRRVRDFFDEVIGTPAFALYGTLLGLHRDGDFIPGDDDFDVAYISDETTPQAVKAETKAIIVRLVQAGFSVSFNRRGRLFRVHHDDVGDPGIHLDMRPMWFMDGKVWVHNFASFPCSIDDFLPVQERTLRGTTVYVPRRPEVFLEGHYGPGWKVPDPGFTYHASDRDPAVLQTLNQLLITPPEYRELKAHLEHGDGSRPGMGALTSIGSDPLYPLTRVVT